MSIESAPSAAEGAGVSVHQTASAAESAVVIQVGGNLYLSDEALGALWTPQAAIEGECPYPGLDAFGPGQAKWFFGRESVTADLLRHLDEMSLGGGGGPLLVVAPSGAGKSSLLGAGLLSALAAGKLPGLSSADWPRVIITPGPHPKATLTAALATVSGAQALAADTRVVLVIDQLEEIFTVCESEAERTQFLDHVATLAADAGPGAALVVLGMRADFYARATGYPLLRRAMQARQVVLGAMSATEVRQAIVRPALAAGLTLEPGLAEVLLHDLGVVEGTDGAPASANDAPSAGGGYEPGRLPLLAHALRTTWERRKGSQLTIAGYEATGGIAGAIARTAEDVYGQLDAAGQAAARQMFLALVRVGTATGDGDATADTRRRVAAGGLLQQAADPLATQAAMTAFTAARLLTSGQAVEITHEALLRRWPRLRGWIDEDRSGLLTRQELEDAAATWAREGRDAAGLWGGVRLATAQAWAQAAEHARELTEAAREFLAAAERRRRRGTRRRNGIIAVLAALSLVLAGLSVYALNQRAAALAQYDHAAAGLLAAESGQAWADFRPDTAQQFAVAAERLDPKSPQVRSAVLSAQSLPIAGRLVAANGLPDADEFLSVAYNPAGTLIAASTNHGGIRLWDAASRRPLWSYQLPPQPDGKGGKVTSPSDHVLFSPDGRTLIATYPGSIWLWNVASPAHPVAEGTLKQLTDDYQTVGLAISPDGGTLAAASYDSQTKAGLVIFWNMATRQKVAAIPGLGVAYRLMFTPDGRTLIIADYTGAVTLWNVATRQRIAVAQAGATGGSSASLGAAALSRDGKTLAFAAGTGSSTDPFVIKLWSLATRQVIQTITAGTVTAGAKGTSAIAFNPAGTQLAASSADGTVRLWDIRLTPAVQLTTLSGHRQSVADVAFSPDGGTLASASYDGTVALWDARGVLLGGVDTPAVSAVLSPDGRLLAVYSVNPNASALGVLLYAMPARKLIATLPAKGVPALAFSPDGKTLAVASPGSPVQLWDVAARRVTATFTTGLQSRPAAMTFSPDGTMLAVSGISDRDMQVWSVPRQVRLASFDALQSAPYLTGAAGADALAFTQNGRVLVELGGDGYVRLFRVPQFTLITSFRLGIGDFAMAVSPDGGKIALGSGNGTVYLMTMSTDPAKISFNTVNEAAAFSGSSKNIYALLFPSNDTLIASGADGVVRFWTVPDVGVPAPAHPSTFVVPAQALSTHAGAIYGLAYNANLGIIVTASPQGTRVWGTNPYVVAQHMCATLKAPASTALWKEYLPTIPYETVCS